MNTLRYPDPDEPDANGATINNMLALGHIVAGDTVEALAGEMGVDAANLQASIDAYNAVVEGGTDEFGFVAFETVSNQYLGGDAALACSPETQARIDRKVTEMVDTQYQKAMDLLKTNEEKLHQLAQYLYEHETITGREFMEILEGQREV